MTLKQATIKKSAKFRGVGLHSGKLVQIEVLPAPEEHGIVFERVDLSPSIKIEALSENVISTVLCTTLGKNAAKVRTVEHLMASFFTLGVDNALVKIDGEEVPILDGSSALFLEELQRVGLRVQGKKRRTFRIKEAIKVASGASSALFNPHRKPFLLIRYRIDFPRSKAISSQKISFSFPGDSFENILRARTFCHLDDVTLMREKGLALGGSFENAIVVDQDRVLNQDKLRFSDEFVKHKLLDCLGDLALLGGRFFGVLEIERGGHTLHHLFAKAFEKQLKKEASSLVLEQKKNLFQTQIENGLLLTKSVEKLSF